MAKKAKQRKAPQPKRKIVSRKQQSLPGMEDTAIPEIENAAEAYAEIRDRRMALTKQETEARDTVLSAMKKHGKRTYRHGEIDAEITVEQEKLKVKIHKLTEGDQEEEER